LLRSWVRLGVENRSLTLPDYLVWGGWLCNLGWFICSIVSLENQIRHPLVEPDLTTDSVAYLVVRRTTSLRRLLLANVLHLDCLSLCLLIRRGALLSESCPDCFLLVVDSIWLSTSTRSNLYKHCVPGLRMHSDNFILHFDVQTIFE
jgi:hypothetical protein